MIEIAGQTMDAAGIAGQYPSGSVEAETARIMAESRQVYRYDSLQQHQFELRLRAAIVNAARALARTRFAFRVFRKSKANPDFWRRTGEGGFQLLPDVTPHAAINDIYANSSMYGTECATAMLIVYYKALADTLPEPLFNRLFPGIYLMNWQNPDRDLGIRTVNRPADYLPGDARYFRNPDVDPRTPQFQGENVFVLGGGKYYGHGIGVATAERIIAALNSVRARGAQRSAYLLDTAERPGFKHLYGKLEEYERERAA